MPQEAFNHAFSQGVVFGGVLAFLFTITAVWSLQLTPAEDRDRCLDMLQTSGQ